MFLVINGMRPNDTPCVLGPLADSPGTRALANSPSQSAAVASQEPYRFQPDVSAEVRHG
jgi:hypothetical protein